MSAAMTDDVLAALEMWSHPMRACVAELRQFRATNETLRSELELLDSVGPTKTLVENQVLMMENARLKEELANRPCGEPVAWVAIDDEPCGTCIYDAPPIKRDGEWFPTDHACEIDVIIDGLSFGECRPLTLGPPIAPKPPEPEPSLESVAATATDARASLDKLKTSIEKITGAPLPPTAREQFAKKCPALIHLKTCRAGSESPDLVRACLMELFMAVSRLQPISTGDPKAFAEWFAGDNT